jgi:hypothetical protein
MGSSSSSCYPLSHSINAIGPALLLNGMRCELCRRGWSESSRSDLQGLVAGLFAAIMANQVGLSTWDGLCVLLALELYIRPGF